MANAILNVGQTGGQVNISTAAAPATPAAGVVTLYAGTDKALHALNSDGVDITIAAAGAGSPITVVNTDTLISDAIGGTAGVKTRSIALGLNATTSQNCSVVIGAGACALGNNPGAVVIGNGARSPLASFSDSGANIAIGLNAIACGSDQGIGRNAIAIGPGAVSGSGLGGSLAIGIGTRAPDASIAIMGSVCSTNSVNIGTNTFTTTTSCFTTALGLGNTVNATSCFSTAVGFCNIIGSGARNSIAVGSSVCTQKPGEIAIGNSIATPATSAQCSVYIGNCITPGGNCQGAGILGQTIIGFKISQNALNENIGGSVLIGNDIVNNYQTGQGADADVMVGLYLTTACSRGNNTIIGKNNTGGSSRNTVIGYANTFTATNTLGHRSNVIIGDSNCLGANICFSNVIGVISCATANFAQAFGFCSYVTHENSTVIGTGVNSERTDTVHVNSLVAYGQAASKTNAIGATGGTVTINWDNSNIQTLTLDSDISTLTKSNPIDGAVYTLFLTQGGTGGKTVSWGADVEWPGGTPPTLSPTAGAVDAVSLVYIAGITGYYGNANLNFS
jgi:hypothetical protein